MNGRKVLARRARDRSGVDRRDHEANGSGLAGQIICGDNFISRVVVSGFTGVILRGIGSAG